MRSNSGQESHPTRRASNLAGWIRRTAALSFSKARAPRTEWTIATRGAENPRASSPSGFDGGRWADCSWSLSERWPNGGQECAPPDAVLGSAEAATWKGRRERITCKRDRPERLLQQDSDMRVIRGCHPKRYCPVLPFLHCKFGKRLSPHAVSRALWWPLSKTTLCLSTRDANKDFIFKQTGSAYGGRAGGGAGAGHVAGRRQVCGRRR